MLYIYMCVYKCIDICCIHRCFAQYTFEEAIWSDWLAKYCNEIADYNENLSIHIS